jgi:uncharacterized protein
MIEPEYTAFARCWDDGEFFRAHEVLEGLWVRTRDRGQQGLIQMAAALYHVQRGNLKGARTMIERALPRLLGQAAGGPIDRARIALYADRLRTAVVSGDADEIAAAVRERPVLAAESSGA